jgi:carboxyl-terminal processing protease
MKSRDIVFVFVTICVLSCLTIAAPGDRVRQRHLYDEYETLSRIVSAVTRNYVEEVDTKKLFYGAYDGMLQTLDPYSAFLPPQETEDLEIDTKGEFGGLGIEITLDKAGVLTVIVPLEGTPAFKAGVLAGDKIIKIEGKSTKGLSLRDAVKQLRGPKGEPVTITVLHENNKVEDIKIVRDIIKLESIKDPGFADEAHKIGYIRLTGFQANSANSLDDAIKDMQAKGMKALILDLRFNPGGLLTAAIDIADRFLDEGVIVSTKGRVSRERIYRAKKGKTYDDFPLAVLISSRSASASEIVAGAIKDHKRGVLVGMRTFGKGSVQSLIKLEDGKSSLRLTTAYYYTPSGRLIHRDLNDPDQKEWGIVPDIEVEVQPDDEVALWNKWRDEHIREAREKNGLDGDHKPDDEKPDATEPKGDDAKPDDPADAKEPKKPVRDMTLEAAINALKGMIIVKDRAAGVLAGGEAK